MGARLGHLRGRSLVVLSTTILAALVLAAPVSAQSDRVTQQDCDALREAGNQELAKTCEDALKLQQEQPPQLQQQGGSTDSGSQDSSAGASGSSDESRPKSDSVELSRTGFPLWPFALAGVACIAGALLLLRRRPDARG